VNISIVTIAYNSSVSIAKLLDTAESKRHRIDFHLFLHSEHPPTMEACARLAETPNVMYYPYGVNRGVSKSWNEGMLNAYAAGADVVLIVNDDIYFSAGDIDKLAERAFQFRESYIVTCAGFHLRFNRPIPSQGYSCFAINPIAIEEIGCFDENISPAYCEDQDYARRAGLAGLSEQNCPGTMVYHSGSAAIFTDPILNIQNRLTHGRNIAYYWRKWGGDGGHEVFFHPFNNPEFGYYIAPDRRHTPYGPAYDRIDHDIVRL
jgi:GT2 family glycosyltransferase